MKKLLVPTDFSEPSDRALVQAIDLAQLLGGQVTLVHVYGLPVYPMLDGAILPTPQTVADLIAGVTEQLEALKKRFARSTGVIETRAVQGPPAETIVNLARDEHFDMIVMGTHGRTGFKRLALGSVAEHVVRTATTPVLTVHPNPDGK